MLLGLRGLPFSVPQLLTQVLAWPPRGRVGLTSHLSVPSSLLLFSVCILPSLMHLCACLGCLFQLAQTQDSVYVPGSLSGLPSGVVSDSQNS